VPIAVASGASHRTKAVGFVAVMLTAVVVETEADGGDQALLGTTDAIGDPGSVLCLRSEKP
jgi:hypothetical protein